MLCDVERLIGSISALKWNESNALGSDSHFYAELGDYLRSIRGGFILVHRVCPFNGSYTNPDWLKKASDDADLKQSVSDWLGTNVTYYRNGEEKVGQTTLFWFDARRHWDLYQSATNAFEWSPPSLDDFAATDATFGLIAYTNRHENEFFIREKFFKEIRLH